MGYLATRCFILGVTFVMESTALGEPDAVAPEKEIPKPAQLTTAELEGVEKLDAGRLRLIELALKTGRDRPRIRYSYGGANPEEGGFDCSGAVYYLLRKCGVKPPRSSAAQFDWIKKEGKIVLVPEGTTSTDAEVFHKLEPGDLLFWSGTYVPSDGRSNKITHVQIYLGREREGGRRVMIGATNGRTYKGTRQNGYGVYDFKMPRAGSKGRFVGFGSPPGLSGDRTIPK
jgi:hypothetical protein